MIKKTRPPIWLGHVFREVKDIDKSTEFYKQLGLRHIMSSKSMAIFELRGGTHLLLFKKSSRTKWIKEQEYDLMVKNIKAFHAKLKKRKLPVSIIKKDYYHITFKVTDPDGNKITVSSDHTNGRTV